MSLPRAIFFGSPEFAVPCLRALAERFAVALVVTQPDRPKGRGLLSTPPAVKVCAEALGVLVLQPSKIRTPELLERIRLAEADVGLVVAYGRILPEPVLEAPRHGCVNVHASLLPRWRGAAPIQWAVVHGDSVTGVTLMKMDTGLDTGPILSSERTPIGLEETAGDLFGRLSQLGAEVVRRDLPRYVDGELTPTPQNDAEATLAPLLTKEDGRIDFSVSARAVHDRVRGMRPWPGAFAFMGDRRVRLHVTRLSESDAPPAPPGTLVRADREGILVACGTGAIELAELQFDGRRSLPATEFVAGAGWAPGMRLSSYPEGEAR